MNSADITSYTLCEPYIDALTFLSASVATCALEGVSIVDPLAMGSLLSAGVNALSISAISKLLKTSERNAYFLKMCAVISALGLSTVALPYILAVLGTQTAVALTYELALRFAVIHLVSKIGLYTSYRIAAAFKNKIIAPPSDLRSNAPPKKEIKLAGKVFTITIPEFLGDLVKKVQSYKLPKIALPTLPSFKVHFSSLNPILSKMKNGVVDGSKYMGRITREINWKKVGAVTLIGLVVIVPAIPFLSPGFFSARNSTTPSRDNQIQTKTPPENIPPKDTPKNELILPPTVEQNSSTINNHVEHAFHNGIPEEYFPKNFQETVEKTNNLLPDYLPPIENITEELAANSSIKETALSLVTWFSPQPVENATTLPPNNITEASPVTNEVIETPPQEEVSSDQFKNEAMDNAYFIGKIALPVIALGLAAKKLVSYLNKRGFSINPQDEEEKPIVVTRVERSSSQDLPKVKEKKGWYSNIQFKQNPRLSAQNSTERKSNSSGTTASAVGFVSQMVSYLNPLEYFQKDEKIDNSKVVIRRQNEIELNLQDYQVRLFLYNEMPLILVKHILSKGKDENFKQARIILGNDDCAIIIFITKVGSKDGSSYYASIEIDGNTSSKQAVNIYQSKKMQIVKGEFSKESAQPIVNAMHLSGKCKISFSDFGKPTPLKYGEIPAKIEINKDVIDGSLDFPLEFFPSQTMNLSDAKNVRKKDEPFYSTVPSKDLDKKEKMEDRESKVNPSTVDKTTIALDKSVIPFDQVIQKATASKKVTIFIADSERVFKTEFTIGSKNARFLTILNQIKKDDEKVIHSFKSVKMIFTNGEASEECILDISDPIVKALSSELIFNSCNQLRFDRSNALSQEQRSRLFLKTGDIFEKYFSLKTAAQKKQKVLPLNEKKLIESTKNSSSFVPKEPNLKSNAPAIKTEPSLSDAEKSLEKEGTIKMSFPSPDEKKPVEKQETPINMVPSLPLVEEKLEENELQLLKEQMSDFGKTDSSLFVQLKEEDELELLKKRISNTRKKDSSSAKKKQLEEGDEVQSLKKQISNTRKKDSSSLVEEKQLEELKTSKTSLTSSSESSLLPYFRKTLSTVGDFNQATVVITENGYESLRLEFTSAHFKEILKGLQETEETKAKDLTKYSMKIIFNKMGTAQTIPLEMKDSNVKAFWKEVFYKVEYKMVKDHDLELPSSDTNSNRGSRDIDEYNYLQNSLKAKQIALLQEKAKSSGTKEH